MDFKWILFTMEIFKHIKGDDTSSPSVSEAYHKASPPSLHLKFSPMETSLGV